MSTRRPVVVPMAELLVAAVIVAGAVAALLVVGETRYREAVAPIARDAEEATDE